jgi:hypothetical protein
LVRSSAAWSRRASIAASAFSRTCIEEEPRLVGEQVVV